MKYFLAVFIAGLALLLSACGQTTTTTNPQVQRDVVKAEATFQRCVPNPLVLLSKGGRQKFEVCAVPPAHRAQFERCLTSGVLHGIPTVNKIKGAALKCLGQVA